MFSSHFVYWNGVTEPAAPPSSVGAALLWWSCVPFTCGCYLHKGLLVTAYMLLRIQQDSKKKLFYDWRVFFVIRGEDEIFLDGILSDGDQISLVCLVMPFATFSECQLPLGTLISQEEPRSILLEQILPSAVARHLRKSPGRRSSCCFDEGTFCIFNSAQARLSQSESLKTLSSWFKMGRAMSIRTKSYSTALSLHS